MDAMETKKPEYTNLNLWWDYGKIKIRQATQAYCIQKRKAFTNIEKALVSELREIEQTLKFHSDSSLINRANTIKTKLNDILKQYTRVSVTNAHSILLNESDTCSKFFFEIEKVKKTSNHISHLKEGDKIISAPTEIREKIQSFYSELYTPEPIDMDLADFLCTKTKTL